MYCGLKDEEWGTAMCDHINNAKNLVTKYGGTVDQLIADPNGKHMGLRQNASHHSAMVNWLTSLNRDTQ